MDKKSIVIGMTGGIGSGKTTASLILRRLGAYIIDTDEVSKMVTGAGSECEAMLKSAFPECVVDGRLVRPLLKKLVFADKNALKLLNSITHPQILSKTLEMSQGHELVVVQVPLLFESGFEKFCSTTVCVLASQKARQNRVIDRDGMTLELADSIMKAQMGCDEMEKRCEFVIKNDGSLHDLEDEVEKFYLKIKSKFGG